jgi:disulfide bond formation protein DsbB
MLNHERTAALIVFIVATLTIIGAWIFEWFGYEPCELCLKQRWAYYAVIPLSLAVAFIAGQRPLTARLGLLLVGLVMVASAIFGVYHAGVEWKWWPGPGACAGGFELKWGEGGVAETPIIRCDEASWRFLGLSFAGWNAVISAALAGIAAYGAAKRR